MTRHLLMTTLTILSLTSFAFAEEMNHSKMGHNMSADQSDPFAASRDQMHSAMAVKPSGNVDADFARNMIPHHEGAVAMAKVELEQGKDPELRMLAEDIIKAQETEIAFMKAWLEQNTTNK